MKVAILCIVVGVLGCLQSCFDEAHADTIDDAVRYFCGPGHEDIAVLVRAEAPRHPTRVVLLVAAESSCRGDKVNAATGALGLIGIVPGKSADPDHLEPAALLDPATNLHLGVRHLEHLLSLCGSFAGALHVYHSKDGKCRNWRIDNHVLRLLEKERAFWHWLRDRDRALRS